MSIDSHIFLEVIEYASFLLSALSYFLLAVLFSDALLVRFDLKTFFKSLGFILLFGATVLNLLQSNYSGVTLWIMAAALSLLFWGFTLDPFSKFKFISPLPLVFLPFLNGHILLFVLGLITTIAIFQLSYTTSHRDFIPLGVGFTLMTVGEYFYYLESLEHLRALSGAGPFLYLFATIVLLGWAWSYLATRFINLIKSRPPEATAKL
ncbi:MAG: hypothetical protein CEO21_293 [Microgenomates group bacterium Gr01-1014_80]|nr:MAG: hypothetical protein CEO21_293 [Microgenomates group bacterium Gr01-1014_80]